MTTDTQDDTQPPVSIKDVIGEMLDEVRANGAINLKAQVRELFDEIEYLEKKGYTIKHIVEKLAMHGITVSARQLSQALYQVRQELKREEEKELSGGKKKKLRAKDHAPSATPATETEKSDESKAPTYARRPAALPPLSQTPGFVRTRVTAELRQQMRQGTRKD